MNEVVRIFDTEEVVEPEYLPLCEVHKLIRNLRGPDQVGWAVRLAAAIALERMVLERRT
jgi:hypothetical protein